MFDRLTAIVLAAGLSRRAAPHHKLLLPYGDTTVVRSTVAAVCGAGYGDVIVVTGHECERVKAALAGLPVGFVFAADHTAGMGRSLAAGVAATRSETQGFAITPGDLPGLTPEILRRVSEAFFAHDARCHVIPMCDGRRGHPVILGAWLRGALSALSGEVGAREILKQPDEKSRTVFFQLDDSAIWRDVDDGKIAGNRR